MLSISDVYEFHSHENVYYKYTKLIILLKEKTGPTKNVAILKTKIISSLSCIMIVSCIYLWEEECTHLYQHD